MIWMPSLPPNWQCHSTGSTFGNGHGHVNQRRTIIRDSTETSQSWSESQDSKFPGGGINIHIQYNIAHSLYAHYVNVVFTTDEFINNSAAAAADLHSPSLEVLCGLVWAAKVAYHSTLEHLEVETDQQGYCRHSSVFCRSQCFVYEPLTQHTQMNTVQLCTHTQSASAYTCHKGKGMYTWYSTSSWNTISEALRYGTCSQGISQCYLHTHTFIRNRNEPYLTGMPWTHIQLYPPTTDNVWLSIKQHIYSLWIQMIQYDFPISPSFHTHTHITVLAAGCLFESAQTTDNWSGHK